MENVRTELDTIRIERRDAIVGTALLLLCGGAIGADWYISSPGSSARSRTSPAEVAPGAFSLSAIENHEVFRRSYAVLVAVIRYGCVHCEKSMPFYLRLVGLEGEKRATVPLVFVAPDPAEDLRELVDIRVGPHRLIPAVPITRLGITGTPTLFLVTRGQIARAWVGELTEAEQDEITGIVKAS